MSLKLGRMLPSVRHWLWSKEKEFNEKSYVIFHLPFERIAVDEATTLILESNVRRPVMEDEGDFRSWAEVQAQEDILRVLKQQIETIDFVAKACGDRKFRKILTWANVYAESEYIPKHTDNEGYLQAVFVLESPNVGICGATILHEPINKKIYLRAGDVLLFKATKLPHSTTPITDGLQSNSTMRRIVLVRRYYADPNTQGEIT